MDLKGRIQKYKQDKEQLAYYSYACFIMSFDQMTDCPNKDKERSIEVENYFYKKSLDITLSPDYKENIKELFKNREELDEITKFSIEIEYRDLTKLEKIPEKELYQHIEDARKSEYEWHMAKTSKNHDFTKFEIYLDKIIDYNMKSMEWLKTDKMQGFDVLLDDMERGATEKMYDEFFSTIEKELVPFTKKILACKQKYNPKLDTLKFDISKQKQLTKKIADIMGYTNDVGCIRETLHPFTSWGNSNDVRTTTRYEESLLFSNLFSIIHEIGHALYQIHMNPAYNNTPIFDDVTCASHESQSRFYENYLARSRGFIHYLYPILLELFPSELKDITEDDIYYYVNAAKAQLIRCEADELTYPLHILIRYKIEKALFNKEITREQIEETFNKYMFEYLGIKPNDKADGCYQDVHWSTAFGYFPTYALGSAYGAQFIKALSKDVDYENDLSKGDFSKINEWLSKNIHYFGATIQGNDLVKKVTGEDFNVNYYIQYLKDKFTKIYLD